MENKHTRILRELAKFFSGVVVSDILVGLWIGSGGVGAQQFLGISFTPTGIIGGIVFDLLVLVLLVHYAWGVELPLSQSKKSFFMLGGFIFLAVALLHLWRLVLAVPVEIGSLTLPFWLSGVGFVVAGFLSYTSFHFARVTRQ
ncbi:MAG: hypothetical protein KGI50_04875 [Patescibacteria group bacterium]|nr:hypothetical protein [Patescibacteria group bacterium]MDE2438628.1 hypothetical protein [Patescibacteria group bacterium]